ncbi:MAG: hypothetical protein ABIO70_31375 [Pseudomonadota bacterium]
MASSRTSRDPVVRALFEALACGSRVPTVHDEEGEAIEPRTPTGADVDRHTHGFHTWPAGLHPDAAAGLLALLPAGPVADPFCGGGTVLVEAMLAGRPAFGSDLSPVAARVARLRTARLDDDALTSFRSAARRATEVARTATDLPDEAARKVLDRWYEPHVLAELESLRRSAASAPEPVRALLEGCLSAIAIKASLRQSDTRAARVTHHRPRGTTAILFHKKARELARRIASFREAVPAGTPAAMIREGDARGLRLPAPVAGILTSPPYPGVYDYLPMQLLRHVWLGLRPEAQARRELGSRRAFKGDSLEARRRWREDSVQWMRAASAALQPQGRLLVVIGDGQVGPKVIGSAEPTLESAAEAGFRLVARASRGLPATQPARQEHALLFEKGG